ncbi:hypothetical protein Salat_0713600 [Sesamum alatum]|uniref:Uncharacterized protein n=1 Tax=Sesamum alatum TaxID=300844 RepID=A0AAE2CUW9_9LAMI|nr:hypothetical protein Salat_0713600 [Sesamum alatum]
MTGRGKEGGAAVGVGLGGITSSAKGTSSTRGLFWELDPTLNQGTNVGEEGVGIVSISGEVSTSITGASKGGLAYPMGIGLTEAELGPTAGGVREGDRPRPLD